MLLRSFRPGATRYFPLQRETRLEFVLDVGGEGRHPEAWNLNPSAVRTVGPHRGQPIPRHLSGRADNIPCPDQSVDRLIAERTPLRQPALREIARVISPSGMIILRHALPPRVDPHALAREVLPGEVTCSLIRLGGQLLQETVFRQSSAPGRSAGRLATHLGSVRSRD